MASELVECLPETPSPGEIGKTIDNTYALGKRHLSVSTEETAAGPCKTWPLLKQVKFDLSGDAIKDEEAAARHAMSKP